MASMGLPVPSAWAASHNYTTMGNSRLWQYDCVVTMSAPTNGAIMAPQYMVAPQYNMTQMPAMGHQCPTQNHFACTQYDSSPTNMSMPFRLPPQQERPAMSVAASEHDIPRVSSYQRESPSVQNDQHRSPSSQNETKMSNPKIPHPISTKEIKYNKPTKANSVTFTTPIDLLMKAIQKKPDSEDIFKGALGIEQVVKSEPSSEPTDAPKPKRYICDVEGCGKSFYQSTHLDTHRRAHTGDKPYQCNWPRCGRTFSQPINLKTHMRRHTGEKPFRCEQCSKAFAQRGNLQAHMVTHTNAKPFVCKLDDCNKMFTQRGNLKNHQNKYHEKILMEMTDWILSISDVHALSDDQREMYWYFANLYKNSNKGIKGRGKDRRVSDRGAKSRAAPPLLKDVCRPDSLAVYSSRQLPPPEQYTQQQQQHHRHGYEVYDTDMDQSSSASSLTYDGLADQYCDRGYSGWSAPYM
ncbi:hypothetical protein LZ31DRAFT_322519 [Colletotrichum somersetense]|nr:hypothetical protein LZ31DRAFT_322519 [Colletotrichum somersetense]